MRDFIACLFIWLGEPLRQSLRTLRRRARDWLSPPPPPGSTPAIPPRAAYDRRPLPDHVRDRRMPLDGHEVGLVRPYYMWFELELAARQTRRVQVSWGSAGRPAAVHPTAAHRPIAVGAPL